MCPSKIYPIKAAKKEEYPCGGCVLINWPKVCKMMTCTSLDGNVFCWTGWVSQDVNKESVLEVADLLSKTEDERRKICQDRLGKVRS